MYLLIGLYLSAVFYPILTEPTTFLAYSDKQTPCCTVWMNNRVIDWLIDWLINWLVD